MSNRWVWWFGVAIASLYISRLNEAYAQISPDATLANNSDITRDGNRLNITGGTQAGTNLFHSFSEFSIPTSTEAVFQNAAHIQNIISRVTGQSISQIDGLIKTQGTANLFLINPNGIIFGKNARLDISGSFIASTASAVKFADGFDFSANDIPTTPLLTINVPIGLQFGGNPGSIQVKGDGQGIRATTENSDVIDTTSGLRVQLNQTLALVGGDIFLEGATIKTAGGRIELGSVGENSLVSFTSINKGFSLGYEAISTFKNIQLSQEAAVDASGAGGDVQVWSNRLTLKDGSQIEANTLGAQPGGGINVTAKESVQVIGVSARDNPSGLFTLVNPGSTGDGGQLRINTGQLVVQDGAVVDASTFGTGKGGNVIINADSVQLIDGSVKYTALSAQTEPGSTGNAGNLIINTGTLLVQDGAQISTGTSGSGKGGDLTVNADSVEVIGLLQIIGENTYTSGLYSASQRNATGKAGNLTINAQKLVVRDVGVINAQTQAGGNGGTLTIKAQQLLVLDGGVVTSSTTNAGKAGDLLIDADSVQIIGKFADGQLSSRLSTTSGIGLLRNYPNTTGDGGNIRIKTGELLVQDGASILVGAAGKGNAGNLEIHARSIRLDNNASLDATTISSNTDTSQQQATITLSAKYLFLLGGSRITTNATGSNLIGGNINIDTDILGAAGNSDISANSTDFRGGRVTINAQGIFGIRFSNTPTTESDITATGANSQLNGTVQINTPDVDPSQGLTPLPEIMIDPATIIAQNPCQKVAGSRFVITGHGGLPTNPSLALTPSGVRVGLLEPTSLTTQAQSTIKYSVVNQPQTPTEEKAKMTNPIVEAQGWVINDKGEIMLTAYNSTATNYQNYWRSPTSCSGS
uniref:Filamentous hemagglutinin N-terminal domain-containing protein n=1 Tax=Desmonostoc muscorum LEGE 12446 TaxID=1828758 RepID=A0A8J6ZLU7_DESMC